jgi:hypothetical protein
VADHWFGGCFVPQLASRNPAKNLLQSPSRAQRPSSNNASIAVSIIVACAEQV